MSKRADDVDEFCDPENPRKIKYEDVVTAGNKLKPFIGGHTPCMASHHQNEFTIRLYYKLEMVLRTGSFKERGAINALLQMTPDKKKLGVVLASLGNIGVSFCYYAQKMSIPITMVMPISVPIGKQQKCHALGAKVLIQGNTIMESMRYARTVARDKGLTYINGRDHPHSLAGFGTIGLEILEQVPFVDAIIVPVGCGGLVASIATVVKHLKPGCLIYGVQPEAAPCFFKSLENGEPTVVPPEQTMASCAAVSAVGVNAFFNALPLIDKMLLVNEDWIARSILHLIEKERFVVEGAGACTLATIIGSLVPELKTKTVVCVLSGGNIDTALLGRCLDRGLAAEARVVKFRVGIKDSGLAMAQLLRLVAAGGYNVIRGFNDRVWVDDDVYHVEVKLVVETRGLEHALELKRIIERAYPCTAIFETEPFNDKRTCPCYVRKASKVY